MSPALDTRQRVKRDSQSFGVRVRAFFGGEKYDRRSIGDLAAVLLASAAFDDGIGDVVLAEAVLLERPPACLCIGIAPRVGEIDLRDARQIFLFQAVATIVFVGDIAEDAHPRIARILILVAMPHRWTANQPRRLLARNIAHLFEAENSRKPIASCFDVSAGSQ